MGVRHSRWVMGGTEEGQGSLPRVLEVARVQREECMQGQEVGGEEVAWRNYVNSPGCDKGSEAGFLSGVMAVRRASQIRDDASPALEFDIGRRTRACGLEAVAEVQWKRQMTAQR
ncbi:hypothetical protein QJS10_CPA08g00207 [Acorus calamus]|uniref:Uncharacterized protein n=1 Tax=Acorus calamus TaxID=4465 RepID=A0AAV9EBJ6_ACOCL|nr:hypothetical protein QJS10_CPA08g00207 [Acorus calamus]